MIPALCFSGGRVGTGVLVEFQSSRLLLQGEPPPPATGGAMGSGVVLSCSFY